MNKPDFRRTPIPQPPADTGSATVVHVSQPLPNNKVIVSDETRKNLRVIGWNDGDPIPAELAGRIKEMQEQLAASDQAKDKEILSQAKLVKAKRTLNLADLPPDKQAELAGLIAEARTVFGQQQQEQAVEQEIAAELVGVRPAAQDAARQAILARREWEQQNGTAAPATDAAAHRRAVPDFRQPIGPSAEVRVTSTSSADLPVLAPEEQAVPQPEPEAPPEPEAESQTGINTAPSKCPRCLWDLSDEILPEPTEREKKQFLALVLGILPRFRKTYSCMDGQLRFVFRSMTAYEYNLVATQLNYDVRAMRITGMGDWLVREHEYRMALAVDKVLTGDTVLMENPEITEVGYEADPEKEETVLVPFTKWFREHVIKTESVQRMAGQRYRMFRELVESMEAMTHNPDFYKGIEPQP